MKPLLDILLPYQRRFVQAPQRRRLGLFSRQSGKSTACAFLAARTALSNPRGLSLVVSTGQRAASEFLKKVGQFAEAVRLLSNGRLTYQTASDKVLFSNGSRVISLPAGNVAALRGWSTNGGAVIIDEAAFVPNLEDVLAAIAPTMTRSKTSPLVLVSTPAGKNGPFYELYQKALLEDGWYVQTTTIRDAVAEGLNVDLEELRQMCPDPDVWSMEYECLFQDEYGAWLNPEDLLFEDVDPSWKGPWWLGLDVGAKRDASGLVQAYQQGGRLVFADLSYMRNTSFEDQFQTVKSLGREKNIVAGFVDEVGIGFGLAERINREISARIKGFTWTASNKTEAYELFKSDAVQRRLAFPKIYEDMIRAELSLVQKIVTPDGKVKYASKRTSLGHGDIASGMVLAHQAWRKMPLNATFPAEAHFASAFRPLPFAGVFG